MSQTLIDSQSLTGPAAPPLPLLPPHATADAAPDGSNGAAPTGAAPTGAAPSRSRAPATPGRRRVRDRILPLGPAALTLVLCLVGIGERGMWNDEYATWYAATLPRADLLRLLDHVDAVLAPYYAGMHLWIALCGDAPAVLRLPSALAMAAAAGLVTVLGQRLFRTGTGLGAGLIFAGLPVVSRYGQEARPYALSVAAAVAATLLLLAALRRPDWPRWAGYAAAVAVLGLVHIVALTILLPHALLAWHTLRTRDDLRILRFVGALAAVVTVLLPVAAKGATESGAIAWIRADADALAQLPAKLFGSAPVAAVLAGSGLLGAGLLWRRHRGATLLLLAWALGPPLLCYLTFPVLHLFLFRYLLFTLPAWVLLAAAAPAAVAELLRSASGTTPWLALSGGLLVAALVMMVGLPGQHTVRRTPVAGEPDFRGAATVVAAHARDGDAIVYAGRFRNGRRAFAYELRGRPRPADVLVATSAAELGSFGVVECDNPRHCALGTDRMFLVTSAVDRADAYAELPDATAALLRLEFTGTEIAALSRVRVWLFTRVSS